LFLADFLNCKIYNIFLLEKILFFVIIKLDLNSLFLFNFLKKNILKLIQ